MERLLQVEELRRELGEVSLAGPDELERSELVESEILLISAGSCTGWGGI